MSIVKTGEVYFRDDAGNLCLAESFFNEETGEVTSNEVVVEAMQEKGEEDPAPAQPEAEWVDPPPDESFTQPEAEWVDPPPDESFTQP